MKRQSLFLMLCATLACLAVTAMPGAQSTGDPLLLLLERPAPSTAKLLPADAQVTAEFRPGSGTPLGTVDFVENDAYILHQGEAQTAYKAKKTLPIFANDTLVVEASSRLVVLMDDQSQFTLSASSWLRLDKSVYDPEKGFRDTVVSLAEGKARFVVKKMAQAGAANFRVDTPVASCGVRGSDFVVALVPQSDLPPLATGWLDRFGPRQAQAAFWQPSGSGWAQTQPDLDVRHAAERQGGLPPTPAPAKAQAEVLATSADTTVDVSNQTGTRTLTANQIIPIYGPRVALGAPLPLTPGAYGRSAGTFSAQPSNMAMPEVFE